MSNEYPEGIPKIEKYIENIKRTIYKQMESYSSEFYKLNKKSTRKYPWSKDPLHQWSRCWEYPYVYQKITEIIKNKPQKIKVLDAGAGWGFFPYFLTSNNPEIELFCLDSDKRLIQIYEETKNNALKIDISDMRQTPYSDGTFDIIYCISVLEHTENYEEIIKEFSRILKSNGKLIVTFDISIDGDAEIPKQQAQQLARELEKKFKTQHKFNLEEINNESVTTKYVRDTKIQQLPWKPTILSSIYYFLKTRKRAKNFYNLAFYCNTYTKD